MVSKLADLGACVVFDHGPCHMIYVLQTVSQEIKSVGAEKVLSNYKFYFEKNSVLLYKRNMFVFTFAKSL